MGLEHAIYIRVRFRVRVSLTHSELRQLTPTLALTPTLTLALAPTLTLALTLALTPPLTLTLTQILSMSDDEHGVTPRGKASGNELLQLVESFEDLIRHRQAEAGWAMYRRIIVCFIGLVSREQLKIKETRNARPSRASIGSKFKLAAKTLMVRVG